ncbi:hypothetical protein LTR08_001837 [Meristemomyces frigidus]|nr:hypothetical protein LTR08_001837 [Meristemomyces frigidus]
MENTLQTKLTSAIIPPHLLKAAYLVGKIPFRACRIDPRISYTLYIPENQYTAVQKDLQSLPKGQKLPTERRLKLVANIPGTRRDASLFRDSLIPFADAHGVAILSPLFPAGLDGPLDLSSFKILRSKTLKADIVFFSILDEVAHMWPGITTERIILSGFSGGAQFAHRLMYLYPSRLEAVALGAPGSVTQLDHTKPWPTGLLGVEDVFDGRSADLDALRHIQHIFLYVGENDSQTAATSELQEWLAKHVPGKTASGTDEGTVSRLKLIKELQSDWRSHGVGAELAVVPDVGHEYTKLLPVLRHWLSNIVRRGKLGVKAKESTCCGTARRS